MTRYDNTFKVTDYSALHTVERSSFALAVEQAQTYAAVGGLAATITDKHNCRWVVQLGAKPELVACVALAHGHACDCDKS